MQSAATVDPAANSHWLSQERPLQTPREVPQSWLKWFRCGEGCWEPSDRGFGGLGVVHVDREPHQAIVVRHLVRVWHPFHYKGSLPGPTY